MVSRPMVPLSGGSSHAAAGAQPIAIAPMSVGHLAIMRTLALLLRPRAPVGAAAALVACCAIALAGRIGALIGVDDLAAGREPDRSCFFISASARSRYLMRKGWPMIIGCSGMPMTRGCLALSARSCSNWSITER